MRRANLSNNVGFRSKLCCGPENLSHLALRCSAPNRSEECVYAIAVRVVPIHRRHRVRQRDFCSIFNVRPTVSSPSVPRLINISGVFQPADGQPASAVETVTLSIYAEAEGGAPLWQETQTIAIEARAATRCCSARPPLTASRRRCLARARPSGWAPCSSAPAKWKGRASGSPACPMRCAPSDADTLGGRPASAYLLAPDAARHHGRGRRPRAARRRRGGGRHRRPSCCPARPTFSPSTSTAPMSAVPACSRPPAARSGWARRRRSTACTCATTTTPAISPASRSRTWEWRGVRLFGHAVLRPHRRARAVPGLQQLHPRIPHQQHRARLAGRRVQRLDQLHARRRVEVHRRSQRQHRHRHHRTVGTARSQQCDFRRAREHVDDQLHKLHQSVLLRTESQRHRRRSCGGAERRWPGRLLRRRSRHLWIWFRLCRRHDGAGGAKLDRRRTRHCAHVRDHADQWAVFGHPDDARRAAEPRHRHHHRAGGRHPRSQQCLEREHDGNIWSPPPLPTPRILCSSAAGRAERQQPLLQCRTGTLSRASGPRIRRHEFQWYRRRACS